MTLVSLLVAVSSLHAAVPSVSVETLIPQMTDLGLLTKVPEPFYTTHQASSYDRASKNPEEGWFANGDAGKFIRVEGTEGRKEKVMADLRGPGAVVRIWSANPAGVVRFYFDGEKEPRLMGKLADLLGGKLAPFEDPFAYTASMGWNIYFPFPYAKSLKITVDDSDNDGSKNLYYHVGYRLYGGGTSVESFTMARAEAARSALTYAAFALQNPSLIRTPAVVTQEAVSTIKAGEKKLLIDRAGPEAIYVFSAKVQQDEKVLGGGWSHPRQIHNLLRSLILEMDFDGEHCVEVPLGDFFGAAPGINPYGSLPMQVSADGNMTCRFVMPYSKSAKVSVRNVGETDTRLQLTAQYGPYKFDRNSMLFRCQWTAERASTRPMHDMNFVTASGTGTFVGCAMHVANPVPDWWGEGDEKVYIDGETFPSTFGTGTEDYYGYAWCCPTPFVRPYHNQPRCDGPANRGHTSVNRWQILDAMPYRKSIRFDIEMWHWAETVATFARTAYWYGKPGSTAAKPVDVTLLLPPEIERPKPVEGALEGENFRIVSKSGGEWEKQGGFWQLSNELQLWWRNGKPGDKLVLEFEAPSSGTFEVLGNFCHARDYGIQKLTINGQSAGTHDFYQANIEWKKLSLGKFEIKKGTNTLEVEIVGTNDKANPKSYMFGLDYLLLQKTALQR